jgi:hypothetical protein
MVSPSLSNYTLVDAMRDWPFYSITPHRVVAFHPPNADLAKWLHAERARSDNWRCTTEIDGVCTENIVVALLRRCAEVRCKLRGFPYSGYADAFCCQLPFAKELTVRLPSGETTTAQSSGQRTYFRVGAPKIKYRYWLATRPRIVRNLFDDFTVVWKLLFHFTDTNNVPLPVAQRQSRRKHLTRNWRNWHWLVRHLGVVQRLADSDGLIRIGPEGSQQVILDCSSLCFTAPTSIDESKLDKAEEVSDEVPVEEDVDQGVEEEADDVDGE